MPPLWKQSYLHLMFISSSQMPFPGKYWGAEVDESTYMLIVNQMHVFARLGP